MNPKFSVILLTTLIGVGQGLFVALFIVEAASAYELLPSPRRPWFYFYGALVALLFTTAGLVASFFHLGRPARAWRSASQWRTSWLSREVIVLPLFLGTVLVYAWAHFFNWDNRYGGPPSGSIADPTLVVGVVGTLLAFALYLCTGMIYACLPFLREWATPLTVINYLVLGLASGFAVAAVHASGIAPELVPFLATSALFLTLLGFATRVASLERNAHLRPKSTLQTAIGVKHPKIVQQSRGFSGPSFNTLEFMHGRTERVLRSIKWIFLFGAFVLPAALLAARLAGAPNYSVAAAFMVQYVGLLAERWYFFAQANHPQNIYYQALG